MRRGINGREIAALASEFSNLLAARSINDEDRAEILLQFDHWADERISFRSRRITQGTLRRWGIQDLLGPPLIETKRLNAETLPGLMMKAMLVPGPHVDDGRLVQAVAVPWYTILDLIKQNPSAIYQIDPFKWEEIIAGAYAASGFDEVILTPRSGDRGRDVIAVKKGVGSIRIFDQVKAYRPGNVVTAQEIQAMLGVITSQRNVSKGVITTTSLFAPRLLDDKDLAAYVPYRLELKPRDALLAWLEELRARRKHPRTAL